jgi:hypothetical protein
MHSPEETPNTRVAATGKTVYQTPRLGILGAVTDLTASGSAAGMENMGNPQRTPMG